MRRFSQALAVAATFVLLTPAVVSADEPIRDHDITVEDYPSVAIIYGCAASPDGARVAYMDVRWDQTTDRRAADVWVVPTTGGEAQRLTFDPASDAAAQWSPDSRWVYFTSNRKRAGEEDPPYSGKTQVWRIRVDSTELMPVTRVEDGVDAFQLSRDGRTLYYSVTAEEHDGEWKDLQKKHEDIIEYGHGKRSVSEIWKLDLPSWRSEQLVAEKRFIRAFTVSPDDHRIAMVTTPDSELISNEGWSRLDVYDTVTKEVAALPDTLFRENAPSPYGWLEELAWSSDSGALAFSVGWDGYPNELFVAEWAGDEAHIYPLTRPDDDSSAGAGLQWRPDSRDLCFLGERRARQHVYTIADISEDRQGQWRVLTPGDVVVHSFSFAETGGRLAVVMSSPTHARDVFLVDKRGQYTRLVDNNPQMATWKLPQISLVTWQGANGDEVEGVLELPYGHDPEKNGPLPLIVELHGGPTASTRIGFRYWCYGRTIMAANGYALLSPNYRGSTGYGDTFMTALIGRENDIEVQDILTGVEAMIDRGIADPERLGVIGWSNGGFLTNAVITHTTLFKAASSGAGIADMLIQWSIEDTPGHVINYMRGLPWQRPEAYIKASPIWKLDKVTAPTLIHVGGADPRVPPAHSRALYRGLYKYCDVPTMLLVYPEQGHGLGRCSMRQAKMEWDLAWFKKHVLGGSDIGEVEE